MSSPEATPRQPIIGLGESEDVLMGMITALAAQLSVTRERLDTVERLARAHGLFSPEDVDGYSPDAEAQEQRDAIRRNLVARIYRPVEMAAARAAENATRTEEAKHD